MVRNLAVVADFTFLHYLKKKSSQQSEKAQYSTHSILKLLSFVSSHPTIPIKMSLASSQSQFLKGFANGAALSKNEGAGSRKTAAAGVEARANRRSRNDDDKRQSLDGEKLLSPSLPQQMVSGIAAASIFANVALVPVALARTQEVYAEQQQQLVEGSPSEVRE